MHASGDSYLIMEAARWRRSQCRMWRRRRMWWQGLLWPLCYNGMGDNETKRGIELYCLSFIWKNLAIGRLSVLQMQKRRRQRIFQCRLLNIRKREGYLLVTWWFRYYIIILLWCMLYGMLYHTPQNKTRPYYILLCKNTHSIHTYAHKSKKKSDLCEWVILIRTD